MNPCLVCGAADPLGIPVCGKCRQDGRHDHDRLLFVLPGSRRSRRAVRHTLSTLTERAARSDAVDSASRGLRAIARVPGAATHHAVSALEDSGLTVAATRPGRTWASLPLSFLFVLAASVALGLLAGRAVPTLLWITPLLAASLLLSALRGIQRPLLAPSSGALSPDLTDALLELGPGEARDRMADLARVVRRVSAPNAGVPRELILRLGDMIPDAIAAARDLDAINQTLADFEQVNTASGSLPEDFRRALGELTVVRRRLDAQVLEITGLAGRLQATPP